MHGHRKMLENEEFVAEAQLVPAIDRWQPDLPQGLVSFVYT